MYHYRKTRQVYKKHNDADTKRAVCPLCPENNKQRVIEENSTMFVLPNRVSYDIFEGVEVNSHLMIIPKRHLDTINDFTKQEKLDFMELTGKYETEGYSVFARGRGSINKSVKHQHTHLLKLKNQKAKLYFYLRKPYFVAKI